MQMRRRFLLEHAIFPYKFSSGVSGVKRSRQ